MKNGRNIKVYKKLIIKTLKRMFVIIGLLYICLSYFNKNYVINVTPSLPIGIYKLEKIDNKINKGDIILFTAKENVRKFMLDRGYISKRIKSFIKRVEGVEGDKISISNSLEINNKKIKDSLPDKDSFGRDLFKKNGEYLLKKDEYFLVGDKKNSFDSSYMGIIKRNQIKYKAKIILEWGSK